MSLDSAPTPLPLHRQAIVKADDADCQVAGQGHVSLLLSTLRFSKNSLKFETLLFFR